MSHKMNPAKMKMVMVGHSKEGDYYVCKKGWSWLYTGTKKIHWTDSKYWKRL